jgi:hypothetical protein
LIPGRHHQPERRAQFGACSEYADQWSVCPDGQGGFGSAVHRRSVPDEEAAGGAARLYVEVGPMDGALRGAHGSAGASDVPLSHVSL